MNWKDIPGYVGSYQVSDCGKVRALSRTLTNSRGRSYVRKGRILKQDRDKVGYRRVTLSLHGKAQRKAVHRLVLEVHGSHKHKDITTNWVDHIDGDVANNHVDNLRWVTYRQNNSNTKKHREGKLLGTLQKPSGLWQARITIEGKRYSLGTYETEQEAHEAYVRKLTYIGEQLL